MVSRKRRKLLGNLLFVLPLIVIIAISTYAFFEVSQPGTLKIITYAQDKYVGPGQPTQIGAPVTLYVNSNPRQYTSPATLSLKQGDYTVTFGQLNWYFTPSSRDVSVQPGQTVYADGVYQVIPRIVQCSQTGFNSTEVSAMHGVTPVIWTNPTSDPIVLVGQPFNRVVLNAGQNFTLVFPGPGSYAYGILSTNYNGTVSVG